MITRIEATNYRCFERLGVDLDSFAVIVGANGSGKTTLLDIPVVLGDILKSRNVAGAFVERALGRGVRASSLLELTFRGQRDSFVLAVEAELPKEIQEYLIAGSPAPIRNEKKPAPTHIRYEIRLEIEGDHALEVKNEYLFVFALTEEYQAGRLPMQGENAQKRAWRFIVEREYGDASRFRPETLGASTRSIDIDNTLSAFAKLEFEAEADFMASRWLLDSLRDELVFFDPQWHQLRKAAPPGLPQMLMESGENLPWLALNLQKDNPERFQLWVDHIRTALPQIKDIELRERDDDHHVYFRVEYEGGYAVTSSGLSEGTLRIFALTLLAYIELVPKVLVVEDPENSIHPQAISTVLESLHSIYDSQVWVSTHSPIVVADRNLSELVTTRLNSSGSVSVSHGSDHPKLSEWKGAVDLGSLFASGIFE